ncbi:HipA protein [Striga asiatica]|uniref:HipA protein n=1 Tax=Striga asiatica TaxID=4170 RepID=A0A5A7QDI6_STRAF|nr:HipA protein [Striga asiatica]
MVVQNLPQHHLPNNTLPNTLLHIHIHIHPLLGRRIMARFIKARQVRVAQGLLHRYPLRRVKNEHPLKQRLHKLLGPGIVDELEVGFGPGSENADDEPELGQAVVTRENGLTAHDFGKDAARGPDVDGGPVIVAREEKLGGAVPASDHVLGHEAAIGAAGAGQPEVADLEVAVGVDEEVPGLKVPVENVRVHQLVHHVQVLKAPPIGRRHHILENDHILVLCPTQQHHLPQSPERVHPITEYVVDFLDGHTLVCQPIDRRANHAVCTSAYGLYGDVSSIDFEQGTPHCVVVLPFGSNSIWGLYWGCHFTDGFSNVLQLLEKKKKKKKSKKLGKISPQSFGDNNDNPKLIVIENIILCSFAQIDYNSNLGRIKFGKELNSYLTRTMGWRNN